jgi:hypothetical protein
MNIDPSMLNRSRKFSKHYNKRTNAKVIEPSFLEQTSAGFILFKTFQIVGTFLRLPVCMEAYAREFL